VTANSTSSDTKTPWGIFLFVFALAISARLAATMETRDVPTVRHLVGDAAGYYAWAQRIAAGDWIGSEGFYQAPLYPYVLAVWFRLFGEGVGTIRTLQAVLGAAGCVLLAAAGWQLWGRRVGTVAGVMLALYGPAVYFDGIVQKASLAGFLTCGLLASISWLIVRPGWRAAGVAGLASGLLSITRENALAWVVVVTVWLAARAYRSSDGKRGWLGLAAFALGVGAILFPVTLRNRVVSGEWSVSTFQAGPNFYIGNHRGADGRYQPLVRGHETPQFERVDATRLAEQELGRTLTAEEVSSFWMKRTFADIRADWVGWTKLVGYKLLLTLNRYEIADAESLHVHRASSWTLGILTRTWHFGTMAPLAAVGILAAWCERRRLWILLAMIAVMTAAVAAFYVLGRYRFPIAVALIPFAARGATDVLGYLKTGGVWRRLVLAAIVGVVVNVPIQDEPRLNALSKMNAGVALAQAGELAEATILFQGAASDHPTSAEARNNLALALAVQNRFAEAVEHYTAALRLEPSLLGVEFNLAVALENVGRADEALEHYRRATQLDPGDDEAKAALRRLNQR